MYWSNQPVCQIYYFNQLFKSLIVPLQDKAHFHLIHNLFATNKNLRIQRTGWNLSGGSVNQRLHPQYYIYSRGLLHRNIPAICQPVDK